MSLLNNRYMIVSELGKGGFGHTFLAEDTHLPSRRRCVIKQFKPVNSDPVMLPRLQERFALEASILERVGEEHSQIPKLYAYFVEDEQFYLVQELIDGHTLGQKVRTEGPLESRVVKEIVSSLLGILDYLHESDIIHRDIKPDNIIFRKRDSKPVLIDFGTVKETVTTVYDEGGAPTSLIIGSPGYMPMEQAVGLAVYASDLYSVGWTAIYLLTAKQPIEMVDRRTGENRWRTFAPDVEDSFACVIDKSVQKLSTDRYETAGDMLLALNPLLPDTVPSPSPVPVSPKPVDPIPIKPQPVKLAPTPRQPTPPIPAPDVVPSDKGEYLIESGDRWRIPLLFLLIMLGVCFASRAGYSSLLFLLITWTVGGILQAVLLRKYINPFLWSIVTTVSAFVALLLGGANPLGFRHDAMIFFYWIDILLVAVGIGQWLVLRRYVWRAKRWYLSAVGTAVLIFVIFAIQKSNGVRNLEMSINWLMPGVILGSAYAYALRHFRRKLAKVKTF